MKRTNTYINQLTSRNQPTSFRERMTSFIGQHTGVFQALTRHGMPYGGNWLPVSQPDALRSPELTPKTMVEVERELDDIILRLSQLSNSLNAAQPNQATAKKRSTGIGIERFRAIQLGT